MRLRTWLILGYSAVLALALMGLGLGLLTVLGLASTSARMVEEDFSGIDLASRLRTLISAQQLVVAKRLVDGDGDVARLMPPFEREALSMLRQARTLAGSNRAEAEVIARAETAVIRLVDAIQQAGAPPPLVPTSADLAPVGVPVSRITPAIVAGFESLRAATLDYYHHHHEAMLARGNHIRQQSDRLALALGLLAVFTVLVGVLTSLRLAERLSAPMERLAEAAARVASGDFEVRVGRTGLSEADLVAQRFDDMAAALARFHAMNLDRIVAESQRMDQVVAHIEVGLMIFDEHGRIERINPVACAQLGLTPELAIGQELDAVADFPSLARAIRTLIARPNAALIDTADITVGTEDAQHTLSWSLQPFSDAARLGLILMLRDVTAARQFERMRTDFVLRASHELRTPITGMRMALGLLEGKLEFPPDSREAELVTTLDEEMRRLVNLISALLDLSRLYAHTYTLKPTPIDVEDLLRRVCKRFAPVVETAGLGLDLALEADLPVLSLDVDAMDRVFDNLLGNAIRHTPAGGRISMGARRAEGRAELWVADNGEGIAYADRARVFEPFVQIGRRVGGVGLGLAMCREIVQQHDGSIRLDSAPGHGSRFTLSFPLRPPVIPGAVPDADVPVLQIARQKPASRR